MSNDKQPEIRFPGFTDEWEQRKLTELATTYIGLVTTMTKNYTEYGTLLIRNSDIKEGKFDLNNPIYLKEDFAEQNKTRRMRNGDVVTVHTGDIGTSAVITEDLEGTIGFATITTRPSKELDSNFLSWYFNSNIHKKYARRMSTGDGRSNYNMKDFNKNVIAIPKLEEQQKIGTFFKQLDDTIALHQRKLDLLKETKKGFLQKMFPKNGAKVPEVRFPGFTEDWEERKFGEIVQVSRGLTYKPSDVQIEGIRVLRSSNINEDVFILRDDDVFVKPDAVNIAPIKNGDILITSANGSSRLVGKHAIVNGLQDKAVHGGFMLRVKSKNTWFTNSLMSSRWYNYFINIYVSGGNGAIGNLRKYDLESQTIIVPDDEEQQKIGAFFKQLDDTIALHQRKLDLLKETKKGFLQKMFV
ncbi:restriction endonuclease subunit S [Enterococcus lactis]|uniref:restriction endonuclease subunit S n=1 Tax=Enterococcus lactis TaxID=357441 RepID=UPI00288E77AB|nr:restriction endonuclease subunit S [Enterococcus lactis]MDT2800269.1 restriction endonuclease subunit S [Enterococcus lactis]